MRPKRGAAARAPLAHQERGQAGKKGGRAALSPPLPALELAAVAEGGSPRCSRQELRNTSIARRQSRQAPLAFRSLDPPCAPLPL